MQAYAKQAAAGAAYMAGTLDASRLIGVVEAFAVRDGVAEVAFAIDANWRRRGIGSALLEAATRWAEQASVATLRMVISRDNWPMRQLAHKAGARLDFDLDEIFADIAVSEKPRASIATLRSGPNNRCRLSLSTNRDLSAFSEHDNHIV